MESSYFVRESLIPILRHDWSAVESLIIFLLPEIKGAEPLFKGITSVTFVPHRRLDYAEATDGLLG